MAEQSVGEKKVRAILYVERVYTLHVEELVLKALKHYECHSPMNANVANPCPPWVSEARDLRAVKS